jgi:hypothetical protein
MKGLPGTNALAYFGQPLMSKKKCFRYDFHQFCVDVFDDLSHLFDNFGTNFFTDLSKKIGEQLGL